MRTHEQHSSSKLAAIVISVLVIAGVVVIADHLKKESGQALTTPSSSITATTPAPASVLFTSELRPGRKYAATDYRGCQLYGEQQLLCSPRQRADHRSRDLAVWHYYRRINPEQ
jgi:hypothetical protein